MRLTRHPAVALIATAALWSGNAHVAEHIFLMHSPIHPAKNEKVTFTVTVDTSGIAGVESIRIRVREYELTNCTGADCLVSDQEIGSCTLTPTCSKSVSAGYQDHRYIRYQAIVEPTRGSTQTTGLVDFAAGAYPWPNAPIPIYVQADADQAIDLMFIPDEDYDAVGGGGDAAFTGHVAELINRSLFSTLPFAEKIRSRRDMWNLYLTYKRGDAVPPIVGNCNLIPPADWTNMRLIIDDGLIVHNQCMPDCSSYNELFSAERLPQPSGAGCPDPQEALVVPVHELAHVAFLLSDEYGRPFWLDLESHNVFPKNTPNKCSNHPPHAGPCKVIQGTHGKWQRSDLNDDIMLDDTKVNNRLGFKGRRRADWIYQQCYTC